MATEWREILRVKNFQGTGKVLRMEQGFHQRNGGRGGHDFSRVPISRQFLGDKELTDEEYAGLYSAHQESSTNC